MIIHVCFPVVPPPASSSQEVLPGVQTIFFKGRCLCRADTYETATCMATGESKYRATISGCLSESILPRLTASDSVLQDNPPASRYACYPRKTLLLCFIQLLVVDFIQFSPVRYGEETDKSKDNCNFRRKTRIHFKRHCNLSSCKIYEIKKNPEKWHARKYSVRIYFLLLALLVQKLKLI